MRVISKSNASSLDWQGVTYEPGPDGVFDFPEPVGRELTTKHASMWVAEDVFRAQLDQQQRDSLRDPNVLIGVVADLVGRVVALEEKAGVAPGADEAQNDSGDEGATEDSSETGADEPKKPTAAQKRAAAKKAAASTDAKQSGDDAAS